MRRGEKRYRGYPPPAQYPPEQYPPAAYPPPSPYPPSPYPPQVAQGYPPPPVQYPPPSASFPPAPYPSSYPSAAYPAASYPPPSYPPPSASFPPSNHSRRALLVGINYINNAQARLNGCINDATYLKFLLLSKFGFLEQNMLVLTDDNPDPSKRPTKANLINSIMWLTNGVQPGDSLFFSFSGHGGQTRDLDGDEDDGMDETILPEDYRTAGSIVDDDMYRMLAAPIPYGAKLTCIMDCCHSGTGLDLPYVYVGGRMTSGREAYRKTTQGDVVLFSSCMDNQTAADSKNLSKVAFSGVLTFTFCQSIEANAYQTHSALLQSMQRFSQAKGFSQIIQLSSGKQMDLNTPFAM